jgi:hypothetical protein
MAQVQMTDKEDRRWEEAEGVQPVVYCLTVS